jgi:hypothetical protein
MTNVHNTPAEDNSCDEHGKTEKCVTDKDYSQYMGYVNNRDKLVSSYWINQRTWKRIKELLFFISWT